MMASVATRFSAAAFLALLYLTCLPAPILTCPERCVCTMGDKVVNCNAKALSVVPTDIPTSVTHLILTSNDISQLSNSSFSGLFDLYSLNLQSNKIGNLPNGAFDGLTNVRFLYLQNNVVSDIADGSLKDLVRLRELYLDNNALTDIHSGIFTGLPELQTLSLGFNAIETVSKDSFTDLDSLQTLYLQNNDVSSIQDGTFTELPSLHTLYLHNNPLQCDCVVIDMLQSLASNGVSLGDRSSLTCDASPFPELVGASLTEDVVRQFSCISTTSKTTSKITSTLALTSTKITLAVTRRVITTETRKVTLVKGLSSVPVFNTTSTNVVTASDKGTMTKTSSKPQNTATSYRNASEAVAIQLSTKPKSLSLPGSNAAVGPSTKRQHTGITHSTTAPNTAQSIGLQSGATSKPISTSAPHADSTLTDGKPVLINMTMNTAYPNITLSQVLSTPHETATKPPVSASDIATPKGNVTTVKVTTRMESSGNQTSTVPQTVNDKSAQAHETTSKVALSVQNISTVDTPTNEIIEGYATHNSTIIQQLFSTTKAPSLVATSQVTTQKQNISTIVAGTTDNRDQGNVNQTSTPQGPTTKTQLYETMNSVATTTPNITIGKATIKDSANISSTVPQLSPASEENTTKTQLLGTSTASPSKQNVTMTEVTNKTIKELGREILSEGKPIPVSEHLIGIQDVTVGETVTIRCDAATSSRNVTYKWRVDGADDPDYKGQTLRYVPKKDGAHRIQCTAQTDDGEGVSDIITLFVQPAEPKTNVSLNGASITEETTTKGYIEETTSKDNQTTPVHHDEVFTSQGNTTSRQFSTSTPKSTSISPSTSTSTTTTRATTATTSTPTTTTITNTTAEVGTTTLTMNVSFPKPDILIEEAVEDAGVPGNGSLAEGPPVRVQEHIIGIQDITVGDTVSVRCDAAGVPAECVVYRWRVDGKMLRDQDGQILRYTPETDGPHKIQCTAITSEGEGISDVITVFALPKGKKLDVITRCGKDPHSGVTWDTVLKECDLHLDEMTEVPVSSRNAPEVAEHLRSISSNNSLTVDDIKNARMVLAKVVNASSQQRVGHSLLETVDQIIDADDDVLLRSQELDGSPSKIVEAMELHNDRVRLTDGRFSHTGKNVAVEVYEMRSSELADGVTFALLDDGSESLNNATVRTYIGEDTEQIPNNEVVASIALPDRILSGPASDNVRLAFTIYQHSKLFQSEEITVSDEDLHPQTINSKVISARIAGLDINNLSTPVVLQYFPTDKRNMTNITCVFWDFAANLGFGDWSADGCSYKGMQNGRVVCECDHLTNFAVLMQHTVHHNAFTGLIVMCKILCALMVIGISFTLITHIAFKELREHRSQIILMNICIALLATLVGFLLGIGWTENPTSCRGIAFFLHYFLLALFVWTAIEAHNIYLAFEKDVEEDMKKFVIKTAVVGWGIPFAVALITLVSDVHNYSSENFCWLEGNQLLVGFLMPAALVLLFNTVTYVIIIRKLRAPDGPKDEKLHDNVTKKQIHMVIIILVLVGLQWIIGFFLIRHAHLAVACVFFVLNSLQALFIFLFRFLLKEDLRTLWATYRSRDVEADDTMASPLLKAPTSCRSHDVESDDTDTVTSSLLKTPGSPTEPNGVGEKEKPAVLGEEGVPLMNAGKTDKTPIEDEESVPMISVQDPV